MIYNETNPSEIPINSGKIPSYLYEFLILDEAGNLGMDLSKE